MRPAAAIFTLLLTTPTASANEVQDYYRCVSVEAVRLSTGPDAADLIARSSAVRCRELFHKLSQSLTFPVAERHQMGAIDAAILDILEARAKRK